jgi:putative phosphoesterase
VKILVVSDLHANYEAVRRLPEDVDEVFCLGDIVDYGPDPRPCIDWLKDRGAVVVRGNHDHAVAKGVWCGSTDLLREASAATRERMWKILDQSDLDYLGALPFEEELSRGGVKFFLVHATPSHPLNPYVRPEETWRWEQEVARVDADVLLVGHTHLPMILRFGRKVIVNPGSVGQPRDGDPRASFAIIEDGEPRLERVAYDVEATVRGLESAELPERVVGQLSRLLRTGGGPSPKSES